MNYTQSDLQSVFLWAEAVSVGDENLKTTGHFKTFQNTTE